MAQDWCLLYGILEVDAAGELYKKVCKRKGKDHKQITPVKSQSSSSSSSSPAPKKNDNVRSATKPTTKPTTGNKKAKIIDDNIDTGLESGVAWESRGTIGV